jgi:hypothetical protein
MNKIIVNTQEELNNISLDYSGEIFIIGGDMNEPILLDKLYVNADVILSHNAVIIMRDSSQVKEMRDSSQVKEMRDSSQVKEMRGSSQVNYMGGSSQVNYIGGSSQVNYMGGSSQVKEMWGSSQVNYMGGSSQVNYMGGSSQVKEMRGSSQVNYMGDSSQVKEMWGSSQVNYMGGSSQVNYMGGSSQVKEMRGSSQVNYMGGSSQVNKFRSNGIINCFGYNYIFISNEIENISNVILNDTSQIIRYDTFNTNPTIDFYLKNYKITKKNDNILLFYKAVHKECDEQYFSDYLKDFKYHIGEIIDGECSSNLDNSCDIGLHVSELFFAVKFGLNWKDLAIIEVEVDINSIVVPKECDGKVRTNKLKVVRELDKSEYQQYL